MGFFDFFKKNKKKREKNNIKVSVSKDNYVPGGTKRPESKPKQKSTPKKSVSTPKMQTYTDNPLLKTQKAKTVTKKSTLPNGKTYVYKTHSKTKTVDKNTGRNNATVKNLNKEYHKQGYKKDDTLVTSARVSRINNLKSKQEGASKTRQKELQQKIDRKQSKVDSARETRKKLDSIKKEGYKSLSSNEALVYQTLSRSNPQVDVKNATKGLTDKKHKDNPYKDEYANMGKKLAKGVEYSEASNPFAMGVMESVNLVPVHELIEQQTKENIDNTAQTSGAYRAGEVVGLLGSGLAVGGMESGARILGQGFKTGAKNFAKNAGKAVAMESPLDIATSVKDTNRQIEGSKLDAVAGREGAKANNDSKWVEEDEKGALGYRGKDKWNSDILDRIEQLESEGKTVYSDVDSNGFVHYSTVSKDRLGDILGYYNNAEKPQYIHNGKEYSDNTTLLGNLAINTGATALGGGLTGGIGTAKNVSKAEAPKDGKVEFDAEAPKELEAPKEVKAESQPKAKQKIKPQKAKSGSKTAKMEEKAEIKTTDEPKVEQKNGKATLKKRPTDVRNGMKRNDTIKSQRNLKKELKVSAKDEEDLINAIKNKEDVSENKYIAGNYDIQKDGSWHDIYNGRNLKSEKAKIDSVKKMFKESRDDAMSVAESVNMVKGNKVKSKTAVKKESKELPGKKPNDLRKKESMYMAEKKYTYSDNIGKLDKKQAKEYNSFSSKKANEIAKANGLKKEDADYIKKQIDTIADEWRGKSTKERLSGDVDSKVKEFDEYIRKRLDTIKVKSPKDERLADIKAYLKDGISLSKEDRANIADFTAWKKGNETNVKIRENGRSVDTVYGELSKEYPDLFPSNITHPADQTEKIAEVVSSLKQKNVPLSSQMSEDDIKDIVAETSGKIFDTSIAKADMPKGNTKEAMKNALPAGEKKYSAKVNYKTEAKGKEIPKKEKKATSKPIKEEKVDAEEKIPFEVTSDKDKTIPSKRSDEALGIVSNSGMQGIGLVNKMIGAYKKAYTHTVSGTRAIEDMEKSAKRVVSQKASELKRAKASDSQIKAYEKNVGADRLSGDLSSVRSSHEAWQYVMNKGIVDSNGKVREDRGLADILMGNSERTEKGKIIKKQDSMSKDDIDKHFEKLNMYMIVRHAIARAEQGKPIYGINNLRKVYDGIRKLDGVATDTKTKFNPHYDSNVMAERAVADELGAIKEDSRLIAKYFEENHPDIVKIADDYDKWWDSFMQTYVVDTGMLSKKQWKDLREMYPHYVPTYREEKLMATAKTAGVNASTSKTIKKASGGDSKVLPIEDQLMAETSRIISASRKNELYKDIYNLIDEYPKEMEMYGSAKWHKAEIDLNSEDLNDLFLDTMEKQGREQTKSGQYTMTFMKDGESYTASISKEMNTALRTLDDPYLSEGLKWIASIGKTVSNPMKTWITGMNPVFTCANILRDIPTMIVQSDFGMGTSVKNLGKAFANITGIDKAIGKEQKINGININDLYQAMGGKAAGYYHQGKGFKDVVTTKASKNPLRKATDVLSAFSEGGESIPRLAEFISTVEKYGTDEVALKKALANSASVTVDFSRSASVTKALDGWVLYLNAAIQGLDKFAKTASSHPFKTAGRASTMMIAPAIVLSAWNADNPNYMDLSERTRQNYFCIPNFAGEKDENGYYKTFFKIPYSREYGTFLGGTLDMALMYSKMGDEGLHKALGELKTTVKTNFAPPSIGTDNIAAPFYHNLKTNMDFAGRKIVPDALKNETNPIEEYDANTSGLAMTIANIANSVVPKDSASEFLKYFKSPKKVDYIIDTYAGYLGTIAQSMTSGNDKKVADFLLDTMARETAADPFIQKFTADPRYSSQPVTDFYSELQKLKDLKGEEGSESYARYKAYNQVNKKMSESYKAEKEVIADEKMSDKEKTQKILEIREERNKVAKSAKQKADKWAKKPEFYSLEKADRESYRKSDKKVSEKEFAKVRSDFSNMKDKDYYTKGVELNKRGYSYEEAKTIAPGLAESTYKKAKIMYANNIKPKELEKAKKVAQKSGAGSKKSLSKAEVIDYIEKNYDSHKRKKVMYSLMANSNWKNPY